MRIPIEEQTKLGAANFGERKNNTLGIEAVAGALQSAIHNPQSAIPIVVDPVMVATSGDPLLKTDAVACYRDLLFPLARVITPNLDEVRTLLGHPVTSIAEMISAGRELAARYHTAVLVKGGHLREADAVDLLFDGDAMHEYRAPFVPGVSTHGTGCTYAAAIAAGMGKGLSLPQAAAEAKTFVTRAVRQFLRWHHRGHTTDALHHFAGEV